MNDTVSQPDFSDVLQAREKVLWQSTGGPKRFDPWAWFSYIFWASILVMVMAVFLSILIGRYEAGNLAGNTPFVFIGFLIVWYVLFLVAKHMNADLTREVDMNYAITNQRLIVQSASGLQRNSVTGRPFVSLTIQGSGASHDISLMGIGEEEDAVVVQLVGVSDAQLAEQLLLKNFMQKTGTTT